MKNVLIFSIIFLVTLLFFQFGIGRVEACTDPCASEREEMQLKQEWYDEALAEVQRLEVEMAKVTQRIKNLFTGKSMADVVRARELKEAFPIAVNIANMYYGELQAAKTALKECEAKYHKCSGCGCLIESEGMTGHRSLLCSANHTYYECNSSDVWTHTTYLNCPVGGESLLACVLNNHQHDVRCSGCQNTYDPQSSAEGLHRLRYCRKRTDYAAWDAPASLQRFCGQPFRLCNSPRGVCSSGPARDLPHSD